MAFLHMHNTRALYKKEKNLFGHANPKKIDLNNGIKKRHV